MRNSFARSNGNILKSCSFNRPRSLLIMHSYDKVTNLLELWNNQKLFDTVNKSNDRLTLELGELIAILPLGGLQVWLASVSSAEQHWKAFRDLRHGVCSFRILCVLSLSESWDTCWKLTPRLKTFILNALFRRFNIFDNTRVCLDGQSVMLREFSSCTDQKESIPSSEVRGAWEQGFSPKIRRRHRELKDKAQDPG